VVDKIPFHNILSIDEVVTRRNVENDQLMSGPWAIVVSALFFAGLWKVSATNEAKEEERMVQVRLEEASSSKVTGEAGACVKLALLAEHQAKVVKLRLRYHTHPTHTRPLDALLLTCYVRQDGAHEGTEGVG